MSSWFLHAWKHLLHILSEQKPYEKAFFLPCTSNTLQGWVAWRDDSLFAPLMKAGRLGLLWSPANFPGCCPIRAGCQAAAGTLQAGLSLSLSNSRPPSRERTGGKTRAPSLAQFLRSCRADAVGLLCKPVILQYSYFPCALMEPDWFKVDCKVTYRIGTWKNTFTSSNIFNFIGCITWQM